MTQEPRTEAPVNPVTGEPFKPGDTFGEWKGRFTPNELRSIHERNLHQPVPSLLDHIDTITEAPAAATERESRLREALLGTGAEYGVGTDRRIEWHLLSCDWAHHEGWRFNGHNQPEDMFCNAARALLAAEPPTATADHPEDRCERCDAELPGSPRGTRLVLVAEDLFASFGSRDEEGRRLTFAWGEPDAHGWYTPTVTVHDDDRLAAALPGLDVERLARALFEAARPDLSWPTWESYRAAFDYPPDDFWTQRARRVAAAYAAAAPSDTGGGE